METNGSNVTQTIWTNEPGEFTNLISQRRGGATQYPHFDALGSTRQLTNSGETITDVWLYDAWGNVLARVGVTIFPMQFVGMVGYFFDPDTNTFNIIRRIYEPDKGRWSSVDPLTFIGNQLSYVYVVNSPVMFADPSGEIIDKIPTLIVQLINQMSRESKDAGIIAAGKVFLLNTIRGDFQLNMCCQKRIEDSKSSTATSLGFPLDKIARIETRATTHLEKERFKDVKWKYTTYITYYVYCCVGTPPTGNVLVNVSVWSTLTFKKDGIEQGPIIRRLWSDRVTLKHEDWKNRNCCVKSNEAGTICAVKDVPKETPFSKD